MKEKVISKSMKLGYMPETKRIVFIMEIDNITYWHSIGFQSQALAMAQFLMDQLYNLEDDINKPLQMN